MDITRDTFKSGDPRKRDRKFVVIFIKTMVPMFFEVFRNDGKG